MKKHSQHPSSKVIDVLARIKVGLSGYVTYLDACNMKSAFSEYVLYEPILRILTARGFSVTCEYPCPGLEKKGRGDKRKLDFFAEGHGEILAIETKWTRGSRANLVGDLEKLQAVLKQLPACTALLVVFGDKAHVQRFDEAASGLVELGIPRIADMKNTTYGCRAFQLPPAHKRAK